MDKSVTIRKEDLLYQINKNKNNIKKEYLRLLESLQVYLIKIIRLMIKRI